MMYLAGDIANVLRPLGCGVKSFYCATGPRVISGSSRAIPLLGLLEKPEVNI